MREGCAGIDWKPYYCREIESSEGIRTVDGMLARAFESPEDLGFTRGAIASFPHTALMYAGPLQSRVVASAYRAGVDRILALGVLHGSRLPAVRIAMDHAAPREARRDALSRVAGGFLLPGDSVETPFGTMPFAVSGGAVDVPVRVDSDGVLADEFSLDTFFALMRRAADLLGVAPIPILPVFVGLTRDPIDGSFAIAERLAQWTGSQMDAGTPTALVTTGDLVHYGTAYGSPHADASESVENATDRFRRAVDRALTAALANRDWAQAHRIATDVLRNDQREILAVVSTILGPARHRLLQFELSDYTGILGTPPPCLVASSLAIYERTRDSGAED